MASTKCTFNTKKKILNTLFYVESVGSGCPISRASCLNVDEFDIELEFRNVSCESHLPKW